MATTTGDYQLPIPESTDTPDVVRDIKALALAVDAELGAKTCTSTTHPTGVRAGELIYETDTQTLLVYDGTAYWSVSSSRSPITNAFTPLSGWAVVTQRLEVSAPLCSFYLRVTNNTGSAIAAGDITDLQIGTFATAYIPTNDVDLTSTAFNFFTGSINSAGNVFIDGVSASIANGTDLSMYGIWMMP